MPSSASVGTSDAMDESDSGVDPVDTSGADDDGDGGGDGVGEQPEDGMYSACLTAGDCVGNNTCVTILDQDGMPSVGFCSDNSCEMPSVDCLPTPAGDTEPFCMNLTLNDNPDTVCALDCSGDRPCPGQMDCWDLNGISICA
jgi:hypothetical protein